MIAHVKLALLLALFVAIIAMFGVADADRYDDCRGGWHVPRLGSLACVVQAHGGFWRSCR